MEWDYDSIYSPAYRGVDGCSTEMQLQAAHAMAGLVMAAVDAFVAQVDPQNHEMKRTMLIEVRESLAAAADSCGCDLS